MTKVSITLPSIHQKVCEVTVNKILEITRDVDYEIVVVSPVEIRAPKVKWVIQSEPMGSYAAWNLAYLHSQGELIVTWADDSDPIEPNWLKNAYDFYLNRSQSFFPYACDINSGVFHIVYGYLYPSGIMISRQSIEKIGGYFDPAYHGYYGDPDLGLRVWAAGGRCEVCPHAGWRGIKDRLGAPTSHALEPSNLFQKDHQTFLNRWHHIYGNNWGSHPSDFNKNLPLRFLRDFGFCEPNPATVYALIRRRERQDKLIRALASLSRRTGARGPLRKIARLFGITTSSQRDK